MENTTEDIHTELQRIQRDIDLIKHALLDEGELTEWAKRQLQKARARPASKKIPHEEVRQLLGK